MNNEEIRKIDNRIEQINNRIDELSEISNNHGQKMDDGRFIAVNNVEEYENLISLKDLLEKNKSMINYTDIDEEIQRINNRIDELSEVSNNHGQKMDDGRFVAVNNVEEYKNLISSKEFLENSKNTITYSNINEEIQRINNRIDELSEISNNHGQKMDDERFIAVNNVEEYKNLINLKNILENSVKFVSYDGLMIREDLIDDYHKLSMGVKLEKTEEKNNENTEESIIEEVELSPLDAKKQAAIKRLEELNISKEFKKQYEAAINKTNDEQDIDIIMNAAEAQNKSSDNTTNLIPGTKIPMPRAKFEDETIEEYEEYLKEHYKPYGYADEYVIYYPNTQIPIPRRPYPHENDYMEEDSYYQNMLNYMSDKYKETQDKINPEYTGPVKEGEQLAVIDQNKELVPYDNNKDNDVKVDSIDDGKEHEVKGIKKAGEFLRKHKKKILIAAGLVAMVAAIGYPVIVPAIMHANSVLWHALPFAQGFLHACNMNVLGPMIGASYLETGLWTTAAGQLINATAATDSILAALGVSALTTGGTFTVLTGTGLAVDSAVSFLREKFKKKKEKQQAEENNVENNDNVQENTNSNENEKVNQIQKDSNADLVEETEKSSESNVQEEKPSRIQQIKEQLKNVKDTISNAGIYKETEPVREDYVDEESYNNAVERWNANNQAEQVETVVEGGNKTLWQKI